MQFSVIYSVDCPEDVDVADFAPPDLDLWDETEGNEQYEYSYLEGQWENGTHRKWCAILDREQFDAFVEHCRLFAESTEIVSVEEVFAGLAEIQTQYRSVSRQCLSSKLFLSAAP